MTPAGRDPAPGDPPGADPPAPNIGAGGWLDTSVAGDPEAFHRVADGFRKREEQIQRIRRLASEAAELQLSTRVQDRRRALALWRETVDLLESERIQLLRLRRYTKDTFVQAGIATDGVLVLFHRRDEWISSTLRDARNDMDLLRRYISRDNPDDGDLGKPNPLIRPPHHDGPAGGGSDV